VSEFLESFERLADGKAQGEQQRGLLKSKRQRENDLERSQENEEPFTDPDPRLASGQSSSERRSVPEFSETFEGFADDEVVLMGRVRSKRTAGQKLIFLDIVNEFQKTQVMLEKSQMTTGHYCRAHRFKLMKQLIQVGDHISVRGFPIRTKSGEPTLKATELPELISPAMEQIPDRLTDPKTKMQERHLDMLVNKDVTDVLRLRAEVLRFMREHFYSKRFLEFQTPILAENAGGAVARPFVTRATEFRNKDLALRVAPELWLKRLVVGGVDKVFEIGPSFRNEGIDATHNPEFTMCEFYSAYSNLADLIKETEELICGLAERSSELIKTQLTSLPPIDLDRFKRPFKQVEFLPGLEKALGFRFPKLSSEDALPELLAILKLSGISLPGEVPKSLPKLLDRLAAVYLEPMSFYEPVFITHHPSCMSPLSKSFLCPKTLQLVSARAELFIGGRELANMYEEENDPVEQKRKLVDHRNLVNTPGGGIAVISQEEDASSSPLDTDAPVMDDSTFPPPVDTEPPILDNSTLSPPRGVDDPVDDGREPSSRLETDADGETSPLDQSFIKALDYALPPTGGWGCGVERLVMLFSGANRISDCLSFGSLRNVVGLTAAEKANEATKPSGKGNEPEPSNSGGEKASGS